jgi:hypothetical protein
MVAHQQTPVVFDGQKWRYLGPLVSEPENIKPIDWTEQDMSAEVEDPVTQDRIRRAQAVLNQYARDNNISETKHIHELAVLFAAMMQAEDQRPRAAYDGTGLSFTANQIAETTAKVSMMVDAYIRSGNTDAFAAVMLIVVAAIDALLPGAGATGRAGHGRYTEGGGGST